MELAIKQLYENVEILCYEDNNGDFYISRKQIGEALEYKNQSSYNSIFQRNKSIIGEPVVLKLRSTDNKEYDTELYSFEQLFQILRFSKQPKANLFMAWAATTLKQLIFNKAELKFKSKKYEEQYIKDLQKIFRYEVNKEIQPLQLTINKLECKIEEILKLHRIYKGKSSEFSKILLDFNSKVYGTGTSGSKPYFNFYKAIENWIGEKLPNKETLNILCYKNTKDYIITKYGIDFLFSFVNGITSDRIVKNNKNNWIDLSGVFQNDVEFEKIKREFNNCCAYCGKENVELFPEHIIPQHREDTTDQIYNIVPSCKDCNKEKYTENITDWYKKQEFYSEERMNKIREHWKKYFVKKDD